MVVVTSLGDQCSSCDIHAAINKISVGGLKSFGRYLEKLQETGTHGFFTGKVCLPVAGLYSEDSHYLKDKQLIRNSAVDVGIFRDKLTKEFFVRKKVSKQSFNKNECIILLNMNHPNIVELFGVIQREVQTNIQVEIYMEYCGPNLNHFLQENPPLSDVDIWSIIYQGISALEYLHRHGVIHFDIKPDNVCIWKLGNILQLKIIDFGSAKRTCQSLKASGWTPEYMSPESCRYALQQRRLRNFNLTAKCITPAVDVFAFGLTIAFILTRSHVLVQTVSDAGNYTGLNEDEQDFVGVQIIWKNAMEEDSFLSTVLPRIACSNELKILLARMCCSAHVRWKSGEILQSLEARETSNATHGQVFHQIQHTMEATTNSTRTSLMSTAPDSCPKRMRVEQEPQPKTHRSQGSIQDEPPDQYQAVVSVRNPHANMPYHVAQMTAGGTNTGVGDPVVIKILRNQILKKREKLRISRTVEPAQKMESGGASESQNRQGRTAIQSQQESPNIQSLYGNALMKPQDGCSHRTEHDFRRGFANSDLEERNTQGNMPNLGLLNK